MIEKSSVLVMASAVTALALAGIYTSFSDATVTGSVGTIDSLPVDDPLLEDYRLVLIEPRVSVAHEFIANHPEIEIQQRFGNQYVALVPIEMIPKLKTMAHVEYYNS